MQNSKNNISAAFDYASHYIQIHGSKMHYIDEGHGDPVLFLHGNPTSSYLWRNIIPHMTSLGRCLAPDLIGMGKSDKPKLAYRFFDHVRYLEEFIDQMKLQNITLVVHDWGSGLGFHYAMRNEYNVKGIAFMEALLRPVSWSQFPADFKTGFKLMRTTGIGWLMISVMNGFVNQILPQATVRKLTPAEMNVYRQPYPTVASRKPVRQWPLEIPIDGYPADVHEVVSAYAEKLQQSDLPKLLFYGDPGGLIRKEEVEWCKNNLTNLTTVDIGPGLHYLQEDNPHQIGEELARWYQEQL